MTDIKQKKENVKMHLKDLRQDLKKMHLAVTEELKLPQPDEVKTLLNGMEFDVAKEMIKTGIETLNSDIDVDALDDEVFDTFLKKDSEDRVVH